MEKYNPLHRTIKCLEFIKLQIFDPKKAEKKTLSKKESAILFLELYAWIILFSVLLYLFTAMLIAWFDIPAKFPYKFDPELINQWNKYNLFYNKYLIWIELTYVSLASGLAFGLISGLTGTWIFGLTFGFAVSLAIGLILLGFAFVLPSSWIFGVAFGFTFGLASGLNWKSGLAFWIGLSLTLGFEDGLRQGLAGGLAFGIAFCLSFFRLIFYPFYFIGALFNVNLTKNAYLKDALIWLPLPHLDQKLLAHSWDYSDFAFQFANFLLEYRPLQRKLAFEIIHTATAATWYHNPLFAEKLILPPIDEEGMYSRGNFYQEILVRYINKAKNDLITAKKINHIGFKTDAWQLFHNTLLELGQETLLQAGAWKHHYLKAIRLWIGESEKYLKELKLELEDNESVARNIYRVGESLTPTEFGKETFVGRKDLRDELAFRILSSVTMPTFLLQGQRRVGKTSLLNFLPELLGSRFFVIAKDCQGQFTISSVFNSFKSEAEKLLKVRHKDDFPDDPLLAWKAFESYFTNLARQKDCKIILGFDEYEHLHQLLKNIGEQGKMILGAMRSFSQHQNQVVFLFTGLYLFADLGEPDFGRYFVHALRLKVDYLKKEDSLKLITQPYPGFDLKYPDELANRIYALTAGHPALLQRICSEMVNCANIDRKRDMSDADLERVLLESVLNMDNEVMSRFWIDFCNGTMKETVREIMDGKKPQHKADVLRLLDYGFIIEDKEKPYKLRVPLFEHWIEKHGESFVV